MFTARLLCSDPGCAEQLEEHVVALAQLDVLVCACGCTFELLAVSLAEPASDLLLPVRFDAWRPLAMT